MRSGVITHAMAAAILALLAGAAAAAGPPQPDALAMFQRIWTAEKNQQEFVLGRSPVFDEKPSHPASDLLSLGVENGSLLVRSPIQTPQQGMTAKVKIGDSDDWSVVSVQGGPMGKGASAIPNFFTLTRTTFEHLKIEVLVLQQSGRNFFNFTMQEITPAGQSTIQLQEQGPNLPARSPGSCQLTVYHVTNGRADVPLLWSSANFLTLSGEHPMEVNRYLRPMFRPFGVEAALAPDPMLSFELFSDQWSPDAATTAKVAALVGRLTGGDFRARAQTQQEIAALGKDGALALTRLDRSKLSAEQNARVDKLLLAYRPVSGADADKFRADPEFLVNCLYSDDPVICKAAVHQLESVTKLKVNFDPAAHPADRAAAVAAVRKQLIDAKVIQAN